MKPITIRCPDCNKKGVISINENLIYSSKRGITAVNVVEDIVCEHSFIVYLDTNFAVRDSFVCDFKIELPQLSTMDESNEIQEAEKLNFYLIMIIFSPITLAYILKACLYKQNTCIICDVEIAGKEIEKLIKHAFRRFLNYELIFLPKNAYRKEKKIYKDYIVIENDIILNDKKKIINPKDIKIESAIVQKFLAENDDKTSLIIIKSEIQKAIRLSEELANYLKSHDLKIKLTPEIINEVIKDKYKINLKNIYLRFLLKIARYYFNTDIAEYLDFVDHVNWFYFIK